MNTWKGIAFVLGGILLGTLLGAPEPSNANAPREYRECGWYCGFDFTRRKTSKLATNAEPMPAGWSVVAGGGTEGALCVLLCR